MNRRCKGEDRASVASRNVLTIATQEASSPNGEEEGSGRIQYFYHDPRSHLPVRDVGNIQGHGHKTEPHLEIGAENYLSCCRQTNIKAHLRHENEKYLFLLTTCRNRKLAAYFGKAYVVGYIKKGERLTISGRGTDERKAIRGKTVIVPFKHAVSYADVFPLSIRFAPLGLVGEEMTSMLVKHLDKSGNALDACVQEIRRLDAKNRKAHKTCLELRGGRCSFRRICRRWNIPGI